MNKRLARLLAEPEHQIDKLVAKLEAKNGYPSHDARLLAEATQKIRVKIADLQLDPDDTTAQELHAALQARYQRDSRLFDEYFAAGKMDFDQKLAKTVQLASRYSDSARQWGLKTKAAKDILRQQPPKKLMKHLNYRSVESLLKRENVAEIYLSSAYIESGNWLKSHRRLVSRLDQTAFEIRSVDLIGLSVEKWGEIPGPADHVAKNEEVAAIGLWPSDELRAAPLMSMVLILTDTLGGYTDISVSRSAAHLNGITAWWSDMDHLIAELGGETVSLSLSDSVLDHVRSSSFKERSLAYGQSAFWRELVSRYEKLPDTSGLFDGPFKWGAAGLKLSAPEPAYEFAEDL